MKQYKILATSITTHLNVKLSQGEIVPEDRFHGDHISDLIANKAIEVYVAKPAEPKNKAKKLQPKKEEEVIVQPTITPADA